MAGHRPWLKYLGIGCGGVVVLFAVAIAVTFFAVSRLTAEPERVVAEFLAAASKGDYAAAHACFSAPLKESQPLEALSVAARGNPSLFDVAGTSFSSRSIDTSGAKLAGTATLRSGTTVPISFSLVQENGGWKLLAYHIGAKD